MFDAAANDGPIGIDLNDGEYPVAPALTEEEYRASASYRKEIPYEPGMTEVRARVYAENFDKRRERELIIHAGDQNGPRWYKPAGFGAGLIGSLPDPINLIPFGGGLAKGAQLAGMTARQVMQSSIRPGIVAGAAGNFASASIAAVDLNRKGEDLGFQDVMLETMFGAVAGPLFHAGGAFLGRRAARKGIRSNFEGLRDALPDGEGAELSRAVDAMKKGDAAAYARHGKHLEEFGGGADGLRDTADFLRNRVTPAERMEIARAMELALHDLSEGRPVDVRPVLENSAVLGKAYDAVLNDPLGGPANEVLAVLNSPEFEKILLERGPAFFNKNGELIVRGRDIARMGHDASGFGLVKIIWRHGEKSKKDKQFKVTLEDIQRLPEILKDYTPEPAGKKQSGGRWSVDSGNGTSLVVVVGKRRGSTEHTTLTLFKDGTGKYPHSPKREALASPARLATEGQNAGGDTSAVPFDRHQQGQGLSEESISPFTEQVNRAENEAASNGLEALMDGGHANPELQEMFAQSLRSLRALSQDRFSSFKTMIEMAQHLSPDEIKAALEIHNRVAGEPISAWTALQPKLETAHRAYLAALNILRRDGESFLPKFKVIEARYRVLEAESSRLAAVESLDWSVAKPQAHEPLPPIKETGGILTEAGIDPHTGLSLDEAALTHLEAEGRLSQADRDAMLAHAAEHERINTLEERAIGIAECVMQVVK